MLQLLPNTEQWVVIFRKWTSLWMTLQKFRIFSKITSPKMEERYTACTKWEERWRRWISRVILDVSSYWLMHRHVTTSLEFCQGCLFNVLYFFYLYRAFITKAVTLTCLFFYDFLRSLRQFFFCSFGLGYGLSVDLSASGIQRVVHVVFLYFACERYDLLAVIWVKMICNMLFLSWFSRSSHPSTWINTLSGSALLSPAKGGGIQIWLFVCLSITLL